MLKKHWFALIILHIFSPPSLATDRWSVYEDLLYWHASEQPTSVWAYQFSLNQLSQGTYFTEPNTYFGWSAGLRLGIQKTSESYFDKKLYWVHFSTKTNEGLVTTDGQLLLPEFFNGFTTTSPYNSADIHWNIEMNIIDAKIGHVFHPFDTLEVHPSVGIKGGTINQSIDSSWQLDALGFILYQATENLKNNFSGIGPSFSIDCRWRLNKCFSLLSDFDVALLWGRWHIDDEFYRPNSLFFDEKRIHSQTKDYLGSFMTSYFLGLEWAFEFSAQVKIKAGYELEFWANQLRLPVFQALPIHGDLTFQGATCGIYITL